MQMIFAVYLNYPEPERNSRLRPTDHHPRAERGGMAWQTSLVQWDRTDDWPVIKNIIRLIQISIDYQISDTALVILSHQTCGGGWWQSGAITPHPHQFA